MSLIDWTKEDAKALAVTLKEPHMEKLMVLLKLACVPDSDNTIIPGVDIKEVASQSYSYVQGRTSMLTEVLPGFLPKPEHKALPAPFQKTPRPSQNPPPSK